MELLLGVGGGLGNTNCFDNSIEFGAGKQHSFYDMQSSLQSGKGEELESWVARIVSMTECGGGTGPNLELGRRRFSTFLSLLALKIQVAPIKNSWEPNFGVGWGVQNPAVGKPGIPLLGCDEGSTG
jgi:hypothetical protein